jgi:hypothetical protein
VSKIGLQCARVVALVGQRVAAAVSQHVRVRLEGKLGLIIIEMSVVLGKIPLPPPAAVQMFADVRKGKYILL